MNARANIKKKNPKIAVIASLIFPGLGQIYNGELRKGIGFIIIGISFAYIWIFLIQGHHIMGPVLVASAAYLLLWVSTMHDAYKTANQYDTLALP